MKRFVTVPAPIVALDEQGQPTIEAKTYGPPNGKGERAPLTFGDMSIDLRRTISMLRNHPCIKDRAPEKAVDDAEIGIVQVHVRMAGEGAVVEIDSVVLDALVEATKTATKVVQPWLSDQLSPHYLALRDAPTTDPRK